MYIMFFISNWVYFFELFNYESKIKKLFKFEYHVHVIHVLPSIIVYGYVYISAPP